MFYGFGASPIVVDDKVILPVDQDHPASYLIAVDKNTGRVRWKVERPAVISGYSTPIVYQPPKGPKQVIVPESFQLSAYSVADGKRVWWVRGLACEMKSIASHDSEYLYINGWGFPQNQPGQQIKTIPFEEALTKFDKDKDRMITKAEIPADAPRGSMETGKCSARCSLPRMDCWRSRWAARAIRPPMRFAGVIKSRCLKFLPRFFITVCST
jgi:hypothetical protein